MKKLVGRTDIEDALGRLDRLTQEEVRMAAAQGLKATHDVNNKVRAVDDKVQDIDDRVQQVADDLGDQKRSSSNHFSIGHGDQQLSQEFSYEWPSQTGSLPQTHLSITILPAMLTTKVPPSG
jgi:hypothetical protein